MSGPNLAFRVRPWMGWLFVALIMVGGLIPERSAVAQAASQRAAPSAIPGRLLYHPYLPKHAAGEQSTVEVLNFGMETTAFSAQFYDDAGNLVKTFSGTLAPAELYSLDLAALSDLPDGDYSLILAANGPLASLVRVLTPKRAGSTIGGLGEYQGLALPSIDQAFAPVHGGEQGSQLVLLNRTAAPATVHLNYYEQSTTLLLTATVELNPLGRVQLGPPAGLSADFNGLVTARSNRPFVGLLLQRHTGDGLEFIPAQESYTLAVRSAATATLHYPLPRLLQGVDLGGGPRSSTLLAAFPGEGVAQGAVQLNSDVGWPVEGDTAFALAGKSSLKVVADNSLFPWLTAVVTGDQPLFVVEETDYTTPSPYATASYWVAGPMACANRLPLPLVAHQPTRYSVIYVQNIDLDTAAITITYRDRTGVAKGAIAYEVQAGGMNVFDLRQAGLPDDFVGSAEVFTPYRLLCAQVDDFLVGQPTNVTAVHLPTVLRQP